MVINYLKSWACGFYHFVLDDRKSLQEAEEALQNEKQSKVSLQVEIRAPEMGTIQMAVAPLDVNPRKRMVINDKKHLTI